MAPASSRVEAAGRMPSIECEPKTLTLDQIKFARVSTPRINKYMFTHCLLIASIIYSSSSSA